MKIYNSMSMKTETFHPLQEGKVSMYVCGPTVYNYPHIGNARPIVVFDTLKRTLQALGYEVKMVSNYTDVDDKIIKVAKELGVSEKEVTEKFIKAYNDDRLSLHAMMPDEAPRVTETMDAIIAFIDLLVQKGYAYQVGGDVYFRVGKVAEYGALSHQKTEDLVVGARIDENERKEDPLDFTLWKQTDEGIQWDSPWSKGRPGWHTECVVMIHDVFAQPLIDIHGGGMDLKFPHHENEIAQARAAYGTPLANYWVHNGMIDINGVKMSKSLGNVRWAKDLIAEHGGNVVRWMMLSAHYRAPLNLSDETLETSHKEYERVANSMKQGYVKLALAKAPRTQEPDQKLYGTFLDAMADDLNTPNAFAAVFEACKLLNTAIRQREPDLARIAVLVRTMEKMMEVLGIEIPCLNVTDEDCALYGRWREAVKAKEFDQADRYRAQLMEKGIL
ncbi:MAG TPA: cysteine--tRNA ligase [Candidatus Merdibacter merdavium]|uniref:Cysteine--tRNA ligase n=1 Tax=Candidatus Merdibacter merdavium TaxID=2838692 RepID=A0A9D2NRY5_9FIRM|nr:cysteine--tRNA ligase [Candidatus Merdibacter merdavium]